MLESSVAKIIVSHAKQKTCSSPHIYGYPVPRWDQRSNSVEQKIGMRKIQIISEVYKAKDPFHV